MEYLGFITEELILFTIVYTIVVLVLNSIWLHSKGLEPCKKWIKEKQENLHEWWNNLITLKKIYFILATFATVILAYSLYSLFPKFINEIAEMRASLSDLSLAVFACLSGIGAVFGFYTSILRTETAGQGLITDRINKAVEGLGRSNLKDEPVIEIRIGGLYALERIAQDSIRDHIQIMEILCAYIRYNSPLKNRKIEKSNDIKVKTIQENDETDKLREDIQAALTIIGRRDKWPEGKKRIRKEKAEEYSLNLSRCDLRYAQLGQASLNNASFYNSNMSGARFYKANLSNAQFYEANLNNAGFYEANLSNAQFYNANLSYTSFYQAILTDTGLQDADLRYANFLNTDMKNAQLVGADITNIMLIGAAISNITVEESYAYEGEFSGCNFTQSQLDEMFCGIKVNIKDDLTRPKYWPTKELSKNDFLKAYQNWIENLHGGFI